MIPKDTEVTAFVASDVCYDTAFLRRVQEQMEITRLSEPSTTRPLLGETCRITVQPRVASVAGLRQGENPSCRLQVLPPSGLTNATARTLRKEMRLVTGQEAEVARRILAMTPDQNWAAGETALERGHRLFAEGSEPSLRDAIEKYREALRHWRRANAPRQHELTLDYLAAAYAALIVQLIEQQDADALREIVAEVVEFDAASGGYRLSGWDSVARKMTDANGGT